MRNHLGAKLLMHLDVFEANSLSTVSERKDGELSFLLELSPTPRGRSHGFAIFITQWLTELEHAANADTQVNSRLALQMEKHVVLRILGEGEHLTNFRVTLLPHKFSLAEQLVKRNREFAGRILD